MRRLLLLAGLASLILPAAAQAADPPVVISELRLRGPSGGSDEFVELRNAGSAPVDVGGWRLVGCSATGPTGERAAIPAATTIPGGGSYLFTNAGASGYSGTVPGDRTYSTGITDTGGVRLENGAGVVDAAGDDGSVCREGGGVSIPTSNADNGFERRCGTQDTDDNAADFTGPKPSNPQNLSEEGGGPQEPTVTRIHDIQGPGAASPKAGQTVTIEGVVTGIDDEIGANFTTTFPADAGIFVQEEPADADADPATSEGIFVGFVRNRGDYPPGTVVRLNGRVRENFGETRIEETVGREPVALGTAPVPAPVVIDPAAAAAQDPGARAYYETLEGVNVRLAVGTATSGGRNKFGETYLTPGVNQDPEDRVFRTDVQPDLIAADSDAGAGDPDKPLKDTDSDTELAVDLFDVVRDLTGPVGFSFGNYKIINQVVPAIEDGPTPYPYTVPTATSDQLRIASFNLENFFPVGGDLDGGPVTLEEYAEKRGRLVDAIGRLLDRPDVVAVQEVHDLAVLTDLATRLGGYTAYLQEGNDSRGIDVGFLVRDTVRAGNVRQLGKDATAPPGLDCSDVDGGLFDRPPLAIDVDHRGAAFTLFSNHFSSKSAPDGCRAAQAAFVRDRVAELEAAGGEAIVAGDLNAFEDESALTTLEGPETSLDNLWDVPPAPERYSFQFGGRLQTLDHVLVTDGLAARVDDFRYAHFDNDYHLRRGVLDGHHVSDHDPPVLTLELVAPPVQKLRPLVLGKPKANHFVLGFPGLWTVEEGSLELTYRWLRCDTEDAGSCEAIGGATRLYYRVQKADRRQYLRFEVTAAGVGGSTVATSRPVAVK